VPAAFEALKYAGAAYLVFLGIQAWRAPVADLDTATPSQRETASRWSHFRGGFLCGISNPKLLVFAAAFFPQFIAPQAPWAPQFLVLVATFLAVEASTYLMLGLGARGLARFLARAVWQRRLNRVSGAIFVAFGGLLLRYKP
jgi:threonine/homoserine/homoserine lactone efflux protein